MNLKKISLLGSTGSIGSNVLSVIRQFPEYFVVTGLAAGKNIELLCKQVMEFEPELVSVEDNYHAEQLLRILPRRFHSRVVFGDSGNQQVAALESSDFTVSAIVGAAGLLPTLAAVEAGKDIGLANKETLVMAGKLVMDTVRRRGVRLFPVDSEHSAIFQALEGGRRQDVEKIILTASGGPFLHKRIEDMEKATPAEALNHPNWSMGKKISIDSATLMNKGLEVIEARWLFDIPADDIEVVVHPQSIVHSLVEFQDGSVLAQLGIPDMRIPIAYALSYPQRLPLRLNRLDLSQCGNLEFQKPDYRRFPALQLAFAALSGGGVLPAVLNAANEEAVAAFLDGKIFFPRIAEVVAEVMARAGSGDENVISDILRADQEARQLAQSLLV
ncbi:MAG: 1-deoxy-D-xylulose-5-phosphate reductoisomerase [Desulfopila sp.]|jgi:1-deoxy-D-xylulose-5-phosphate reductoisomerase|nr:1-deoxy-D-xylulose-5-phosphate reductoisomerase [Desulfopila sp.]